MPPWIHGRSRPTSVECLLDDDCATSSATLALAPESSAGIFSPAGLSLQRYKILASFFSASSILRPIHTLSIILLLNSLARSSSLAASTPPLYILLRASHQP